MNSETSPGPIVVGVDGSTAAIEAAVWAAKEAVHYGVTLRLVHVIHVVDTPGERADADQLDREYAETCLRSACSAVQATQLPVHLDTAVLHGATDATLIEASETASLICLGSTGIGRMTAAMLGSTAAAVAERARCRVAIIRHSQSRPLPQGGFIVAILDGRPGCREAMGWAMEEARMRKAPVLALGVWPWPLFDVDYERFDRHIDQWLQRYPDVTVEVATTRMSAVRYLEGFVGALQLVVIASADAGRVVDLIGPHTMSLLAHADCSVLVAHDHDVSPDPRARHVRSSEMSAVPPAE